MRSAVFVRVLQIVVVQAVFQPLPAAQVHVGAIDRYRLTSLRAFRTTRDHAFWLPRGPVVANQPSSLVFSTAPGAIESIRTLRSSVMLSSDLDSLNLHSARGAKLNLFRSRTSENDGANEYGWQAGDLTFSI